MAYIDKTIYHKYLDLQNVSGSGDPESAPVGGVYLFASGSQGSAKLYLQNEAEGTAVDLAGGSTLTVAGDTGSETIDLSSETLTLTGGTGIDTSAASDTVTFTLDLNELSAAAVDVANDSIAIVDADDNSSKKESIADLVTAMAGDALAASSGVLAVQVGSNKGLAITSDALEITGSAVAAAAVAVADDTFMFFDADGSVKEESFADLATAQAGTGLAASSGVLSVDLNEVSAATVDVGADSFAFIDADDNGSKKDSIADLVTAMAGTGLAASSGVLSADLNEISAGTINVGADSFAFIDADDNGSKKDTIADLMTAVAGDGLAASSGVLAVQVGTNKGLALTSDALEITGSAVADGTIAVADDTFMFFDADGSVKEESIADLVAGIASTGLDAASGQLSVDVSDFLSNGADNRVVTAAGADSLNGEAELTFDGSTLSAGVSSDVNTSLSGNVNFYGGYSASPVGMTYEKTNGDLLGKGNLFLNGSGSFLGGYSSSGVSISTSGLQSKLAGEFGQDGGGVDFTVYGASTGEKLFYDASENLLHVTGAAAGGLDVKIGGDSADEYAIDVADGSNNNNKIRAAAFVTYSDESLKTEVQTMNTALDTVMSLEGVEFTWKNSGERDFGFIAQDVQRIVPKAVHTAQDGIQGVDYSRLTSILVEAVKSQQVQIEELKAILKK